MLYVLKCFLNNNLQYFNITLWSMGLFPYIPNEQACSDRRKVDKKKKNLERDHLQKGTHLHLGYTE